MALGTTLTARGGATSLHVESNLISPHGRPGGMSLGRVALGLTLLGSVGCATLRPVHDPAEFITRNHPRVVVITYLDNSSLYVAEPLHDLALVQAPQRDMTSIILFVGWIAASAAVAAYGYNQAVGGKGCSSAASVSCGVPRNERDGTVSRP